MKKAIDARPAERLAEIGTPRSNMIRARVRRSRPRPPVLIKTIEGDKLIQMKSGKDCPRHRKAENILTSRLADHAKTMSGNRIVTGYHKPGSLQFR